jgi:two-component system sensor histidine kinase RegB
MQNRFTDSALRAQETDRGTPLHAINFVLFMRLRWAAMLGQVVTMLVVDRWMGIALPLPQLFGVVAIEFVSNVGCLVWLRQRRPTSSRALFSLMTLDTVLLTALLYLTGGPFNPFSFLYLVQIALAALALPARGTWALVALALGCSGFLFLDHHELTIPATSHADHMRIHLQGMWVAFGVAAAFIVYFLMRLTRALSSMDGELVAARDLAARKEKLASLATLAAGTAHELATPLSTIATAARELELSMDRAADVDGAKEDLRLIRDEVRRCRAILDRMSLRSGELSAESLSPVHIQAVIDDAVSELPTPAAIHVEVDAALGRTKLFVPPKALSQILRTLIKNGQDASEPGADVIVRGWIAGAEVHIEVSDQGTGMVSQVLERAGEPFFTTKAPGVGMGLGLFVARSTVEQLGGRLSLRSEPRRGTAATIVLPLRQIAAGTPGGAQALS